MHRRFELLKRTGSRHVTTTTAIGAGSSGWFGTPQTDETRTVPERRIGAGFTRYARAC